MCPLSHLGHCATHLGHGTTHTGHCAIFLALRNTPETLHIINERSLTSHQVSVFRVPTASYKSYNLTRCPIFVLYFGEEGICPIFFLKMSYKSYNLGVLSYNFVSLFIALANAPF